MSAQPDASCELSRLNPPAMRNRPSGSGEIVARYFFEQSVLDSALELPVAGSKISAVFRRPVKRHELFDCAPPAIKTWPLGSRAATWPVRSTVRLPIQVNFCVNGSYSSTRFWAGNWQKGCPSASNTRPSAGLVAVEAMWRKSIGAGVGRNWLLAGSYSSALDVLNPLTVVPEASRTLPSPRSVAVCCWRGVTIAPLKVNSPVAGL